MSMAMVQLVFHFVGAQLLGVIMFYVGLRSYLALTANWMSTHLFITPEVVSPVVDSGSLGELLDCILSDSYSMITNVGEMQPACIGPIGPSSTYGLSIPFNKLASIVNLVGATLVFLFILVLVIELCSSGAQNIGQGRYLAFTYKVQDKKSFKILSWVIVIFVLVIVCDTIKFFFVLYAMGKAGYIQNFAEFLLPTLLTLGYSAYSLGSAKVPPFFDYDTEEFLKLQFKRGWSDLMTDNNTFAQKLGLALLQQKRGSSKALKEMVPTGCEPPCSTLQAVIAACDKPTEKDSLI